MLNFVKHSNRKCICPDADSIKWTAVTSGSRLPRPTIVFSVDLIELDRLWLVTGPKSARKMSRI